MNPEDELFNDAAICLRAIIDNWTPEFGSKCESPIELLLWKALTLWRHLLFGKAPWNEGIFKIECQEIIGNYRVDFVVRDKDKNIVCIIEADGHDFHERTKEQAIRDRSRDRDLQTMGYMVLRFTGSEIYRDPWQCAVDVWEAVRSKTERTSEDEQT